MGITVLEFNARTALAFPISAATAFDISHKHESSKPLSSAKKVTKKPLSGLTKLEQNGLPPMRALYCNLPTRYRHRLLGVCDKSIFLLQIYQFVSTSDTFDSLFFSFKFLYKEENNIQS